MKSINIYTDGACSGNQSEINIGGWGCILEYGQHKRELYGGELNTTNNRMELYALISGLSALKEAGLHVRIFSDSAYLVECFRNKWHEKWQINGWKTTAKKPVENQDLWVELLGAVSRHKVEFYRVKGHLNLRADKKILNKAHEDFVRLNGKFSFDEFLYIVEQNVRADELANKYIDDQRCGGEMEDKMISGDKLTSNSTSAQNRPAILFDLDGTLWDSAKQVGESWNIALEEFADISLRFTTKMIRQSMGKVLEEIALLWFPEFSEEKRVHIIQRATEVELEYLKTHPGKLFPKTEKTLKELSKSYNLFVVSNCQIGYIEGFFEGTGLKKYFMDYECAGNTGKPKADNIKAVMERNHLNRCLYVGDTQKDCDASDLAGIPFVHASYGFGTIDRVVPKVEKFEDLMAFADEFFG
jgi:ribonuclease HI